MTQQLAYIILAAGKSQRASAPKGLIIYKGKPLLLYHLKAFSKIKGKKIFLVLGKHYREYLDFFPFLMTGHYQGLEIEIICNHHYELGPFYSIQLALKESALFKGVFISPIDCPPDCRHNVMSELSTHFTQDDIHIPSCKSGEGHPILLGKKYYQEALKIAPQSPEGRLDYFIQNFRPKKISTQSLSIKNNFNFL